MKLVGPGPLQPTDGCDTMPPDGPENQTTHSCRRGTGRQRRVTAGGGPGATIQIQTVNAVYLLPVWFDPEGLMARWDEDNWDGWDAPPRRSDGARPTSEPEPHVPPPAAPAREELEGTTFMIADDFWGIDRVGSADHPGACVWFDTFARNGFLSHGTDAGSGWAQKVPHHVVGPTPGNGLGKATAFVLELRRMNGKVLQLHHGSTRRLGRLSADDLADLRRALIAAGFGPREGRP